MSTHDLDIANAIGSSVRTDLNLALKALGSLLSNSSAPAVSGGVTVGCVWLDTTSSPYKLMIHNGTGWVEVLRFTSGGSPVVTVAGVGTAIQAYDATIVKTGVVNAFTKQQTFTCATLTDGASIAWDLDNGQFAQVTIAGNRTMAAPSNIKNGGTYILRVKQDGTGGRTLAWNASYKFIGATPVISAAANAVDYFTFVGDGTNMHCIGIQQGF